MAYVALYRKYRSQSFGEVVGQEHVTTVLQNALRQGRIAHAYLFCGPRGCGKTSTARLLARALNCQKGETPTPEPCGVCEMCVRIRDGSSMDVIEMDAASETGIDDVREKIIENAKYAPGEARFKVYIIDEVHDLSLKAFDSLLKTLEEPPPHVVFILATTEAHKVPITIRSRCQRMDFRRGTLNDLAGNLERVLAQEGIECEPEAVAAIARAAEGSFRDSLSLLEQVMAYTDGKLTAEAVHAAIGTVGPQMLDEITRTLASDDMRAAFLQAGELVESGKDVKQTLIALQGHLRDLLVARISEGRPSLEDVSPERFAQLKEQARGFSVSQLLRMLDVLAEAERDIRFTNQHRLLLERAFWSLLPSRLAAGSERPDIGEGQKPTRDGSPLDAPHPAPERPAVASEPSSPRTPEHRAPSTESVGPRFAEEIDLDGIRRLWPRVVRRVTQVSRAAHAIFTDDVQVMRLDGRVVVLGFPDEFKRSRADKPRGREALEQALATELGLSGYKVRCVLTNTPVSSGEATSAAQPTVLDLASEPVPAAPMRNGSSLPPRPTPGTVALPPPEPAMADSDEEFLTLVMEEFDGRLVEE